MMFLLAILIVGLIGITLICSMFEEHKAGLPLGLLCLVMIIIAMIGAHQLQYDKDMTDAMKQALIDNGLATYTVSIEHKNFSIITNSPKAESE